MLESNKKIFVAGHGGMVGSSIVRYLEKHSHNNIVFGDRGRLDLVDQKQVSSFFDKHKPDYVVLAAAKVGGIHANNTYPAEFIYQNLMMQANVIHSAYITGVSRLLFLGSSCIYPKMVSQPMREDALLTGTLEATNEPYAIAKIAGIKLCESYNRQYGTDFRSVMPTNLYGLNDNFHSENSHVIPGLIRRFHDAKNTAANEVVVWGSGKARREFLHVDDMASAGMHVLALEKNEYEQVTDPMLSHINIGCGEDISIAELSLLISDVVGFDGDIVFDTSKPDGTPKKLMSVDKLFKLGWCPEIELKKGLQETYQWFLTNQDCLRS